MDPDAAYDLMTDTTESDEMRALAADGLAAWIRLGGFLPSAPYSTVTSDAERARLILAECGAALMIYGDPQA